MKCFRVLWWLPAVMMLAGCEFSTAEDFEDDETEFENNASVPVLVTPAEEEAFIEFTLQPGTRTTISRNGARATFTFQPSDSVKAEEVSNEEVVFTDL